MKFLLGASTAAHQVEGNNVHSDSWAQENLPHSGYAERSGDACDHYNRFEEDIRLLAGAGLNAYRFSIEWARIEPECGKFDENELKHYEKVLKTCVNYGVEPIVTLHHFSSPLWLIQNGGWENEETVGYFSRYVGYVVQNLSGYLSYICTINEANMGGQIAAMAKKMLQSTSANGLQVGLNLDELKRNAKILAEENNSVFGTPTPATFLSERSERGEEIIFKAHLAAKDVIKRIKSDIKVGLTLSLHDIQCVDGGEQNADKEWQDEFLRYVPYIKNDDFIGVQNYTRKVFSRDGEVPPEKDKIIPQTGYEYYPQSVGNVAKKVYSTLNIPVLITENGIATDNDDIRCEFIKTALCSVKEAIGAGVPVLGYLHWSLLDNFEWQKGYKVKFGLIGFDKKTKKRMPKRSLKVLAQYTII